jgi:hypothetical protein
MMWLRSTENTILPGQLSHAAHLQVNHGQVASGPVPQSVIDNDIDGELSEEDAHRYNRW